VPDCVGDCLSYSQFYVIDVELAETHLRCELRDYVPHLSASARYPRNLEALAAGRFGGHGCPRLGDSCGVAEEMSEAGEGENVVEMRGHGGYMQTAARLSGIHRRLDEQPDSTAIYKDEIVEVEDDCAVALVHDLLENRFKFRATVVV